MTFRRFLLCGFAVAALAASAPRASASVEPARAGGELLAEAWAQALSGGTAESSGGCTHIARDVLVSHPDDALSSRCRLSSDERLFVMFGSFCISTEDPELDTREEQLACAVASDQAIEQLTVTVDGRRVDIHRPRFELFSPQREVLLSPQNVLATFTAHAWGAVVTDLCPGRHTIVLAVVATAWGAPPDSPIILTTTLLIHRGNR